MNSRAINRRKKTSTGIYALIAIIFLALVIAFQLVGLRSRQKAYAAEEQALKKELILEQEKKEELKDYEAYTKTYEYIENTARSKGGLVKQNEIIFREQK